jgi:transcriptional regulator with XRE-family HTH domain
MHKMSYLSATLSDALKLTGWNQTQLASAAEITHSQVNRACRGTVSVGPDTIHAIAKALPAEHQGPVVAAWLKDQLKPELLSSVEVYARSERLRESEPSPSLPEGLDPETRNLILWLAHQAIRHTAVVDALHSLRRAAGAIGGDSKESRFVTQRVTASPAASPLS